MSLDTIKGHVATLLNVSRYFRKLQKIYSAVAEKSPEFRKIDSALL